MGITVGKITEKLSELKSRLAIIEGLVLYLATNYRTSADGMIPPEMHFTRVDGGHVSEPHIESFSADLVETLDQLRIEIQHWEDLEVPGDEQADSAAQESEQPEKPPAKEKQRGSSVRTKDRGQGDPASGNS